MLNTEPSADLEFYASVAKDWTIELYQNSNKVLKEYEPLHVLIFGAIFAIIASFVLSYL
jgi:hypothetical protein